MPDRPSPITGVVPPKEYRFKKGENSTTRAAARASATRIKLSNDMSRILEASSPEEIQQLLNSRSISIAAKVLALKIAKEDLKAVTYSIDKFLPTLTHVESEELPPVQPLVDMTGENPTTDSHEDS